jgi:hypothetical protein
MKTFTKAMLVSAISTFLLISNTYSQTKERISIVSVETNGLLKKQNEITSIVNFEFQKLQFYEIVEKRDLSDYVKSENINPDSCFSLQCLINIGELVGLDKIVSGSIQRMGEKIMLSLRIIDVKSKKVIKYQANEYLNVETEIQQMVELSVRKMHDLTTDQLAENYLIDKEKSINQTLVKNLKLSGPRMGASYITGEFGKRLSTIEDDGGYNIFPLITQFGYQYEIQYLGAGNFQALFEFIGMLSGMEHQMFIPGITVLNGFRNSKTGIEFAFGPTFGLRKTADGYYDENNQWHLMSDFVISEEYKSPKDKGYKIIRNNLDKRGHETLSTGWVWAIGKTFRSGHLNIPINAYVVPRKEGWYVGLSMGFNIRKK